MAGIASLLAGQQQAPLGGGNTRSALLSQLMQQQQQQANTPIQAIANQAGSIIPALMQIKQQKAQEDMFKADIAKALSVSQGGVAPWTNPDTGQQVIQGQAPGQEAMLAALMGGGSDRAKELGLSIQLQKALQEPDKLNLTPIMGKDGTINVVDQKSGMMFPANGVPGYGGQAQTQPMPPRSRSLPPENNPMARPQPQPMQGPIQAPAPVSSPEGVGKYLPSDYNTLSPAGRVEAEKQAIKDAAEAPALQDKEQKRKETKIQEANVITQDITRALGLINDSNQMGVTGGMAALVSKIPGTESYDVSKLLDTVKANIGFGKLQNMRESSPTGGALGQVSDFENKNLQATAGNLEQAQSSVQLTDNLKRVFNQVMDTVHGTPEHIQSMIDSGQIAPEVGKQLMFRHDVSFEGKGSAPQGIPDDLWGIMTPEERALFQ